VVAAASLTELEPVARAAVLDALATGADFPIVLVEANVVASGVIDVAAVIAAVRGAS
jgi:hypothetical protein